MPGLLRGVARTAVVAGTATAVSGRVARRQANRYADQDAELYAKQDAAYQQYAQPAQQQYAPPPAAVEEADPIEQLKELAHLRETGIRTDVEYPAHKATYLG